MPVEEEDVRLLDLAVRDVGAAVIDELVPRADHLPLVDLGIFETQRRLDDRGNAYRNHGYAESRPFSVDLDAHGRLAGRAGSVLAMCA